MRKLLLAALAAIAVASCDKDPGLPPIGGQEYEGEANTTVAELHDQFAETDAYATVTDDIVIRGIVVGNDASGNIFKQIYIQDGGTGINIGLDANELNSTYKIGQEVFVELKGLAVGRYGGELQIGYMGTNANRIPSLYFAEHIFANGLPDPAKATPKTTTIGELTPDMVNTLVRLDGVKFEQGGSQPFATESSTTNRTLTDGNGGSIIVRTSNYADFHANTLPTGEGSVIAVLGRFNGDWQLLLRTADDVIFDGYDPGDGGEPGGDEEPPVVNAIYRETFGTAAVASPWPLAGAYTSWAKAGSGATTVTYEGQNASIRSSGRDNTGGYANASGPNHVFFGAVPNEFVVKSITMPASATKLKLTFGGQFYNNVNNDFKVSEMAVSLSANGTDWTPLTYTISGDPNATPNWIFATADFTLTAVTSRLYIKFSASVASVYRVDDITLTEGEGGQSIDLAADGGGDTPGGDEPGGDEPGGDEPGGGAGEYFAETFGDGTLTATGAGGSKKIAAYTAWSGSANYADSYASADIRKTTTMNEALWLPQNPDTELVISGLPAGKTGITLSFDIAAQDKNTNANLVQIFANGTKLTSPSNEFTTTNTYVTLTVKVPDGTTSLRFFSPAGTNAFRIDNVKLSTAE